MCSVAPRESAEPVPKELGHAEIGKNFVLVGEALLTEYDPLRLYASALSAKLGPAAVSRWLDKNLVMKDGEAVFRQPPYFDRQEYDVLVKSNSRLKQIYEGSRRWFLGAALVAGASAAAYVMSREIQNENLDRILDAVEREIKNNPDPKYYEDYQGYWNSSVNDGITKYCNRTGKTREEFTEEEIDKIYIEARENAIEKLLSIDGATQKNWEKERMGARLKARIEEKRKKTITGEVKEEAQEEVKEKKRPRVLHPGRADQLRQNCIDGNLIQFFSVITGGLAIVSAAFKGGQHMTWHVRHMKTLSASFAEGVDKILPHPDFEIERKSER